MISIKISKKILALTGILLMLKVTNAYAITIVGDVNNDNLVDSKDISAITTYYETNNSRYDLNKDGIVDIFDLSKANKNMSSAYYRVYNSSGILCGQYASGKLMDAINNAVGTNGEVVQNGQVVWDNNNYYVFNGQTFISRSPKYFNADLAAKALSNGIVIGKNGSTLLNKATGYKIKLAYAQDALNFRKAPNLTAGWDFEIPKGSLIELTKRTNGYYEVKYNYQGKVTIGYVTRYVDIFTDDFNDSFLGYVSEKYESNGNPGTYSTTVGDAGGTSYGPWQLAVNTGSVDSFLMWLSTENTNFYNTLITAKKADNNTYGTNFNNAWAKLGADYFDAFYEIQRKYIKTTYYDQLVKTLQSSGVDYTSRLNDVSVRNMLWSTAVQHGVTGASNIVKLYSGVTNDSDFISNIYDERSKVDKYFSSSSDDVKQAVKTRFTNEKQFVLRILSDEKNY